MSFTTWTPAGQTTINDAASMSSSQTTITLAAAANLRAGQGPKNGSELVIAIGDEQMRVTGVADNVVTVERGYNGTTAATHNDASPVYVLSLSAIYKLIKAATLLTAPGS